MVHASNVPMEVMVVCGEATRKKAPGAAVTVAAASTSLAPTLGAGAEGAREGKAT